MFCSKNNVLKLAVFVSVMLKSCSCVIYSLNESEYDQMPPLYALDRYDICLAESDGTYCVADFHLFAEGNSSLMKLIEEYSAYTLKHFNHTQIHRGVCVTRSCKEFTRNKSDNSLDLNQTLEACLNSSLWQTYGLQAKLTNVLYCDKANVRNNLDSSDIIVLTIYIILIGLNTVGSMYDVIFCKKKEKDKIGNPYLLAFSIFRNWSRLVAPSGQGSEPRLARFKSFNGLRTMTMICVIFSHTVLIMSYSYIDNPLYIEKSTEDPLKQLLFNGSLVTHTFFVMSSFLLAYNFQLNAEKHEIKWTQVPKGILLRWLRLSPVFALVLATISTLMRHAGSGPLWKMVVNSEADACRQYWWAHLLYINNYLFGDLCMPQTWYLAADTQLFCVGILICFLARTPRSQKVILSVMFLLAISIVAGHTYFQDLDAVVMQSPEKYRNVYENDKTFHLLYIRGHTNLSTYTLGLAGGLFCYYLHVQQKDWTKYRNYRWAFWMVFLTGVAVILSGGIFYRDDAQTSMALKVLYAMLYKPVFQLHIVILILGCALKFENIYRGILEWRGFTWMGRVSYSAFLSHTMFQRGLVGIQTAPIYMSDYYVMVVLMATILLSFISAAFLWLCVEAPVSAIIKAVLQPASKYKDTPQESSSSSRV